MEAEPDNASVLRARITDLERRLAETQGLAARARAQEQLLELVDEAVMIADPGGTITYCNRAAGVLYGWPAEQLWGQSVFQVALADVAAEDTASILERVVRGDGWWGESRAWRRDGSIFPTAVAIAAIQERGGEPGTLVSITTDLTAQRALEDRCRQAQKMESVGLIAGGVAHDFNNLLTVIGGYGDLALTGMAPDDPVRDDILQIVKAASRASTLTSQLLTFSRRQTLDPMLLDLNAIVHDLLQLIERVIGADVELNVVPASPLWPIRADRGQIEQVLVNLVVNARDAVPAAGWIVLETANVTLEAPIDDFDLVIAAGDYVLLSVRDSGHGMDAETRRHIFEPFYTTKEAGRGTGLGLATVYGIVQRAGGSVRVESEVGQGTAFSIYFPRAGESRRRRQAPPGPLALRGGSETILLVEDDDHVRPIAERVLARLGYTVLPARGAEAAFGAARDHAGTIDLLLTDVVLPRSDGIQLAARLAPMCPRMQILYISGHADTAQVRPGPLPRGARFLAKPFTPDVLARAVREALDAKAAPEE